MRLGSTASLCQAADMLVRMRPAFVGAALLACLLYGLPSSRPAAAQPRGQESGPGLAVRGGERETVVFQWSTQRCDTLMVPDSPARAIRTPEGGVALLAAYYTNVVLLGPNFDALRPSCATASRGAERPEPEAFDDRYWVQGLVPLPDGHILGLASHEFRGDRHEGLCDAPPRSDTRTRCWYSSITATVADPRSWRFQPLPLTERVVASPPVPYDRLMSRRMGYFTTTNVVFDGAFAYMLVLVEGVPGQPNGTCLLRAPRGDLIAGWRALAGGEFRLDLRGLGPSGPGRQTEPCDIVGADAFRGPVRSVVRLGTGGPWAAVFSGRARDARSGEAREGVFASYSRDLVGWSAPSLVWDAPPFRRQQEPGLYYNYPSLIDHESPSPVFDTAGGALHLYMTRLNFAEDRRRSMDRDLVRIRVEVAR
jgi:hypothetical protein